MDNLDNYIHLIRKQRHDFINDLQVIYGYLQIGKINDGLQYIEKLNEENKIISSVYALGDNALGLCMEENIKRIIQKDIHIEIDMEIEEFYHNFFYKNYAKKQNLVNNIFNKFENNNTRCLYIYFFEDKLGQSILLCNDESIKDELNWMESWQKIKIELNDLNLYKCICGNNIGYRITVIDDSIK